MSAETRRLKEDLLSALNEIVRRADSSAVSSLKSAPRLSAGNRLADEFVMPHVRRSEHAADLAYELACELMAEAGR